MGIYDIKAIKHLFIEDVCFDKEDVGFDIEEEYFTESFSTEDNKILKVL